MDTRMNALLAALLLASSTSHAAWTANGPDGGYIFDLVTHGNAALAATGDGIYRSIDGGLQWARLGDLPRGLEMSSITASHSGERLWATSQWSSDVFRSTDFGRTWTRHEANFATDVVIHPLRSESLIAYNRYNDIPMVSQNGGESWRRVVSPADFRPEAIAADHAVAYAFYAAVDGGLMRSVDGGLNWTPLPNASYSETTDLVVDPFDPNILLTSHGRMVAGSVGRYVVNSQSYTRPQSGSSSALGLVADPTTPGRFWWSAISLNGIYNSDVYESTDHGNSWHLVSNSFVRPLAANAQLAGHVFAARAGGGLALSVDAGRTWLSAHRGIPLAATTHVLVDPTNPYRITVLADGRLQRSNDGAGSWHAHGNLPDVPVTALARAPSNPAYLLATVWDSSLYASQDNGAHWQRIAATPNVPHNLTVDATDSRKLALTDGFQASWSDNGGTDWRPVIVSGGDVSLRYLVTRPNGAIRYYGLVDSSVAKYHVVRAEQHGALFQATSDREVSALAVHPTNDLQLLALEIDDDGQHFATWHSRDGGDHWTQRGSIVTPSPGFSAQLTFDTCDTQTVYALAGDRAWRSTDQGRTWQEEPLGIPSSSHYALVSACHEGRSLVVAATRNAGAQVRTAEAIDRVFTNGFEAD
ncbi:WD40/YVTN/BNR-like repeat-containing protein [Tahibacter amnicola]|uniref:Sortilin N-terminal domain-containing protein n=1 Tax=Tahibacter amnicola TaxID=2976241 RepID=A0ABY6BCJ2_9GAMM|nr:hypothetical protein [Tahibacter amnicola]UXI67291.1 hypothetical protein N4264_21515 [Tahibacter amnicola]